MSSQRQILLNPGPVTLSERVRTALGRGDWCHREPEFAALMQERATMAGKRVGVVLSGGNVDRPVFAEVLAGKTPKV